MSGYKRATVTIGQDEYDRLREAESKLRSLPAPDTRTNNHIIEESIAAMHSSVGVMQQRQALFETFLDGVDSTVRNLEIQTNQALLSFGAQTMDNMQQYAGCLWNHVDEVVRDYSTQFEYVIAANHRQQQEELAVFSRQIRRMSGEVERKRELAVSWLDAAEQFRDFINETYAHEHFTPGRVDHLDRLLSQARQNMEIGLSEAVIVSSQQVYMAFSDLRIELERMQNEWELLLQAAWEATFQLYELCGNCRMVEAVDLEGKSLPYEINVDHWTQGRLTELINEISSRKRQLQDGDELPDSEGLRAWLDQDLPDFYRSLENLVLDARISALNSQLRINIADLVVQALQEQGFSLEDSHYSSNDMRLEFGARLMNLEGNEVIVQVAPTGNLLGENELQIRSLDSQTRTEHELEQRWYEVSRSLNARGIDVGQYTREPSTPKRIHRQPGRRPGIQQRSLPSNLTGPDNGY